MKRRFLRLVRQWPALTSPPFGAYQVGTATTAFFHFQVLTGIVVVVVEIAWVRRPDDSEHGNAFAPALPSQPNVVRVADHHFAPQGERDRPPRHDQPPTADQEEWDSRESRWKTFTRSTAYPRSRVLDNNIVSYDWLNQNLGDYSEPWQGKRETSDLESGRRTLDFMQRRKIWMARFQFKVLHSAMVPLLIRLTVFVFCAIALALGGSIRHFATIYERPQGASTDMAIIVDTVALVYLVYITYDEYTGKPLGLRAAKAKMRLIFLDLIFIVFASANLSLAFYSLSNVTGSCTSARVNDTFDKRNDTICVRQEALASVLLIVLIAWLMTFAISVLRYVIQLLFRSRSRSMQF